MKFRAISHLVVASAFAVVGREARATDATTSATKDCLAASEASFRYASQHKLRDERAQLIVCAADTRREDVPKESTRRVDYTSRHIQTHISVATTSEAYNM